MERLALAHAEVQPFLAGKQVKKVIVVPGKLVNIAAG
jgi:leucyl-tRNA synthetase